MGLRESLPDGVHGRGRQEHVTKVVRPEEQDLFTI
jgi:hypothetical protein